MATICTIDQNLPFTLSFTDRNGNPAPVDGAPVVTTSDATVGVVEMAPDGLSGMFVSAGAGVCQVQVTADADLGAGVVTLTAVADVEVQSGQATAAAFAFGPAVAKS